jgi:hypothetical protein
MPEVVAGETHRHGVDGEVSTPQVVGQWRRGHARQLARRVVDLLPGGREVVCGSRDLDGRGPEALVLARVAPEPLRHRPPDRARIALDGDVDVVRHRPAQEVADRAAHEVGGLEPLERREQPLHARHAPHPLAELAGGRAHQSLTGIPASRIRSFASRTVC